MFLILITLIIIIIIFILHKGVHYNLYKLLKKIINIANSLNIPIWPVGGTLLGAIRHQGIIPWDDDIDLACWEGDVNILLNNLQYPVWHGLRCIKIAYKNVVIDLFPSSKKGQKIYFQNPLARAKWPLEYFTEYEFGNQNKKLHFGPVVLSGADHPCSYLDRVYPEWWKYGIIFKNHSTSSTKIYKSFNSDHSRQKC